MAADRPTDSPATSHWPYALVLAAALVSTGAAVLNLLVRSDVGYALGDGIFVRPSRPSTAYLLVALLGLAAATANLRLRPWRRSVALLALLAALTVAGLTASLLYRDDYTGGTCGARDWPSLHLHAGYPYSWLDGHACRPPDGSPDAAQPSPYPTGWAPDPLALLVDLTFWGCVGITVVTAAGLHSRRPRRPRLP